MNKLEEAANVFGLFHVCKLVKTIITKSKMKDLNELRDRAYKTACEHGFHEEELSDKHSDSYEP